MTFHFFLNGILLFFLFITINIYYFRNISHQISLLCGYFLWQKTRTKFTDAMNFMPLRTILPPPLGDLFINPAHELLWRPRAARPARRPTCGQTRLGPVWSGQAKRGRGRVQTGKSPATLHLPIPRSPPSPQLAETERKGRKEAERRTGRMRIFVQKRGNRGKEGFSFLCVSI